MDAEDKIKRFLEKQMQADVDNISDFEVWQSNTVSRLSRHLDVKTNDLLRRFKEIPSKTRDRFPIDFLDPFIFNKQGFEQAKKILKALKEEISDAGLPSSGSSKPYPRKRKNGTRDADPAVSVINVIEQKQSQTINIDIKAILQSELNDIQLKELQKILKGAEGKNKRNALQKFFKNVGQGVAAKILAAILLNSH